MNPFLTTTKPEEILVSQFIVAREISNKDQVNCLGVLSEFLIKKVPTTLQFAFFLELMKLEQTEKNRILISMQQRNKELVTWDYNLEDGGSSWNSVKLIGTSKTHDGSDVELESFDDIYFHIFYEDTLVTSLYFPVIPDRSEVEPFVP